MCLFALSHFPIAFIVVWAFEASRSREIVLGREIGCSFIVYFFGGLAVAAEIWGSKSTKTLRCL